MTPPHRTGVNWNTTGENQNAEVKTEPVIRHFLPPPGVSTTKTAVRSKTSMTPHTCRVTGNEVIFELPRLKRRTLPNEQVGGARCLVHKGIWCFKIINNKWLCYSKAGKSWHAVKHKMLLKHFKALKTPPHPAWTLPSPGHCRATVNTKVWSVQ